VISRLNLGVYVEPEVIMKAEKVRITDEEREGVPCYFELTCMKSESLTKFYKELKENRVRFCFLKLLYLFILLVKKSYG
jgi:hypothetical protein